MNSEFYRTSPSQPGGPVAIMLALMVGVAILVVVLISLVVPLA